MIGRPSRITLATLLVAFVGATLAVGGGASANQPGASPSLAPASALPGPMVPGSMAPVSSVVAGHLTVEGAWARVSPMVERAGAAYMVIRSRADTDDALVGVTSPAATIVETHLTEADASGVMTMRPVPEILVPAGGMVELMPGGYHLMLIDLVGPLEVGTDVELVLTFRSGIVVTVHAPVRPTLPMGSPGGMSPTPGHGGSPAPMGSPTP